MLQEHELTGECFHNFFELSQTFTSVAITKGGGMVEWFRALDLKSGGPWFKSFTLPLSGFVLGSPEFNSSTALCKQSTGQSPFIYCAPTVISTILLLFN